MNCIARNGCVCALAVGLLSGSLPAQTPPGAEASADTHYGLFNWLDHRSAYGEGVFPEPFLVDDSDLEPNEARLDWLRTGGNNQAGDWVKAEVEHAFGLATFELEVPYERDRSDGEITQAFENVSLGARYPLQQFVSPGGLIDSTIGAALEVGIPVNSAFSRNTEVVPKIFDDLRVGPHFTLQSILGYSALLGDSGNGGLDTFEYGFVFGYSIPREILSLPGVLELIPVFELRGETQLNQDDPGNDSLLGNAALRLNLKAIGGIQPRLGLGFVFPLDQGARSDTHWGIFTSLVLQY